MKSHSIVDHSGCNTDCREAEVGAGEAAATQRRCAGVLQGRGRPSNGIPETGRLQSMGNSTLAVRDQRHTALRRSWNFNFINLLIGYIPDSINLVKRLKQSEK